MPCTLGRVKALLAKALKGLGTPSLDAEKPTFPFGVFHALHRVRNIRGRFQCLQLNTHRVHGRASPVHDRLLCANQQKQ